MTTRQRSATHTRQHQVTHESHMAASAHMRAHCNDNELFVPWGFQRIAQADKGLGRKHGVMHQLRCMHA